MTEPVKIFIDASAFLSMHSSNKVQSQNAASFFAALFYHKIYMSLEQVGLCDDIIWAFPRKQQDEYYPFMDRLHSDMKIVRIPYDFQDVERAQQDETLGVFSPMQAMVLSQVMNHHGCLYSANEELLNNKAIKNIVRPLPDSIDQTFNAPLQNYYEKSLMLTLHNQALNYA